jgi:Cu(I)/Ag(I) efflux system membrane fusion protein
MLSQMVITVGIEQLNAVIGRQRQQPCVSPHFRRSAPCLLIFLDGKDGRPDDLGEAVIGNFHKESTAFGWQSPLRFCTQGALDNRLIRGDMFVAGTKLLLNSEGVMATVATKRTKLFGRLAVGAIVLLIGVGLWYAHGHGWLAFAYHQLHQLASKGSAGKSESMGGMNMPGMGMDMGDMKTDSPSDVPGHAEVTIPSEIQQRIGVTVAQVKKAPLVMSVRTVGIIRPNEEKIARIHLKTEGWVDKLFVNFTGQKVEKGKPLLAIYSPQFLTTQQEYLNARRAESGQSETSGQSSVAELARRRLELWDVPPEAIKELDRTGKPQKNLILESPLNGTVLEKNVLEKEYITPQKELYVIADLSTVWVQAKVYEYELPHVELGQPATVTLAALPDQKLMGKVVFVQPTVEEKTRTVEVRIELPNPKGLLKPGMFADIDIQHTMGEGLLVPTSAVIRTGERDIVFLVKSANEESQNHSQLNHAGRGGTNLTDRFVPKEIKIDTFKYLGDRFHVLEGLKAGDRVVTSANFLIDSESRLRLGGSGMAGMPGMDMGNMKGMDQGKKGGMEGMDHSKMKH